MWSKYVIKIIGAGLIAAGLNILMMAAISRYITPTFGIIYLTILPGTLAGAFLLGYWLKSKGWFWGALIPVLSMLSASLSHSDRISEIILIYLLQLIPAGIMGEIGARLNKSYNKEQNAHQ